MAGGGGPAKRVPPVADDGARRCLGGDAGATAFFQVPDEPSPASGTAQVVAQGVVDVASGDLRWVVDGANRPAAGERRAVGQRPWGSSFSKAA